MNPLITLARGLAYSVLATGPVQALDSYPLSVSDQIVAPSGSCNDTSDEFWWSGETKAGASTKRSLPAGTYRPVLNGTAWRFTKTAEWNNWNAIWGGDFVIEVVRVEVFGAETVVSRFSRSYESRGGNTDGPAQEEFNTFSVTATEVGAAAKYRLRTSVHAWPCSRAALRDVRVDLIKEK